MGTKLSELPANTTPEGAAIVAVVEGGTTSKSTLRQLMRAVSGWFEIGNGAAAQTGIGTSATEITVNGATSDISELPSVLDSVADVFENGSNSRLLFENLTTGDSIHIRLTGDIATSSANTGVRVIYSFYDDTDTLIFNLEDFIGSFKSAGTYPFMSNLPAYVGSAITDGYVVASIQFDTGASNQVQADGFFVQIN